MVEQDRASRKMLWLSPWNRPALADTADAMLQGHPWCGHNDAVDTPDELRH